MYMLPRETAFKNLINAFLLLHKYYLSYNSENDNRFRSSHRRCSAEKSFS